MMKTDIEKIEVVTGEIIIEDFYLWHNINTLDDISKNELKDKMMEFFIFLEEEK